MQSRGMGTSYPVPACACNSSTGWSDESCLINGLKVEQGEELKKLCLSGAHVPWDQCRAQSELHQIAIDLTTRMCNMRCESSTPGMGFPTQVTNLCRLGIGKYHLPQKMTNVVRIILDSHGKPCTLNICRANITSDMSCYEGRWELHQSCSEMQEDGLLDRLLRQHVHVCYI